MEISKHMAVVTAVASLTGAAGVAAASPAVAQPDQTPPDVSPLAASDCPSGYACIWSDQNFSSEGSGRIYIGFRLNIPDYRQWSYAGWGNANDTATSVSSNGRDCRYKAYFYDNYNFRGELIAFERNTGDGNLDNSTGNAGRWFDDIISSGRFLKVRESC